MSLLTHAVQRLTVKGIADPYREARLLLAHCLGTSYEAVFLDPPQTLSQELHTQFENFISRRLADEPLSRIKGEREFWGQKFLVTPDTLDPRPDSETLIEAILECFPDRYHPYRILDLGTGTGCLLLSLLKEYPEASGVGVDICEKALQVASQNTKNLRYRRRCEFICGNWVTALSGKFDIIVCNPPYIATHEELSRAVHCYDPHQALYAGTDGLETYRELFTQLKKVCYTHTYLFFEVGYTQWKAVNNLITQNSGKVFLCKRDLHGHPRVAVFAY